MGRGKGCDDNCSFLDKSWDYSILSTQKQIEIEQALKSETIPLTMQQRQDLLSTKVHLCIGGLIKHGKKLDSCDYFMEYPDALTNDVLSDNFRAIRDQKINLKWKVSTFVFAVLTIVLTYLTYVKPGEEEYKTAISDLESKLDDKNKFNTELQIKIDSLKNELRRIKNSQGEN